MNVINRSRLLVFVFLCGWIFSLPGASCFGADPISIKAKRMLSTEQKNSVIFIGEVDARQGDTAITCDEMTVYYKQNSETDETTSQVEKMICIGNVQATCGNWLGISKRMDYFAPERKIVLIGNAKAWKGQNMVQGETITHYLDEGRSTVEQGSGESDEGVNVIIQQDS